MGRIGFRQALAEVVAVNLAGVNTSRLNTWRSLGRAPRAERLSMAEGEPGPGECRRRAPRVHTDYRTNSYRSIWPRVFGEVDWCTEFVEREEEDEKRNANRA
jgi:hypothetical protein